MPNITRTLRLEVMTRRKQTNQLSVSAIGTDGNHHDPHGQPLMATTSHSMTPFMACDDRSARPHVADGLEAPGQLVQHPAERRPQRRLPGLRAPTPRMGHAAVRAVLGPARIGRANRNGVPKKESPKKGVPKTACLWRDPEKGHLPLEGNTRSQELAVQSPAFCRRMLSSSPSG